MASDDVPENTDSAIHSLTSHMSVPLSRFFFQVRGLQRRRLVRVSSRALEDLCRGGLLASMTPHVEPRLAELSRGVVFSPLLLLFCSYFLLLRVHP